MTRLASCLLLLTASVALADGPDVKIPPKLEPKGGYAIFVPDKDVVSAVYIALDGEEPFPVGDVGGDSRAFVLPVRGLKANTYRFVGVFANEKGQQTRRDFSVPVGVVLDPGNPPTKPDDPVKPPPVTGGKFFAVIRQDGPASPEISKMLGLPEWQTLRREGHTYKDYTRSEAIKAGIKLPPALPLPSVLTFLPIGSANGKPVYDTTPTRQAAAPTDGASILKLAE